MSHKAIHFVIAIDGPAASGKGTLAKRIAQHYHLPHLDTGLSYRAVGNAMLANHLELNNQNAACQAAQMVNLNQLDISRLSCEAVADAASKIAVFPKVREILVQKQRDFIHQHRGCVVDGRDVGTVICPNARVKFFVTASLEERALRRYEQNKQRNKAANFEHILQTLKERDERDRSRENSPLICADNAYLLDTTKKSIKEALEAAIEQINLHL